MALFAQELNGYSSNLSVGSTTNPQVAIRKRGRPRKVLADNQIAKGGYVLRPGLIHPLPQRKVIKNSGILECYHFRSITLRSCVINKDLVAQKWETFLSRKFEVHNKFTHWFYRYAKVETYMGNDGFEHIRLRMQCGDEFFTYSCYDFREDFGLECSGYPRCGVDSWPHDLPSQEEMNEDMQNQSLGLANDKCHLKAMAADHVVLINLIRSCILPTDRREPILSDAETTVLYLLTRGDRLSLPHIMLWYLQDVMNTREVGKLPFGGFITHVMRKWNVLAWTRKSGHETEELKQKRLMESRVGRIVAAPGHFFWGRNKRTQEREVDDESLEFSED